MTDVLELIPADALPDVATPSSEGAWRLAWWLSGGDARFARLARNAAIPFVMIDRLLDGTVIPLGERGEVIAEVTGGAVLPGDWEAPALTCEIAARWTDRPPARRD